MIRQKPQYIVYNSIIIIFHALRHNYKVRGAVESTALRGPRRLRARSRAALAAGAPPPPPPGGSTGLHLVPTSKWTRWNTIKSRSYIEFTSGLHPTND